MSPGVLRSNPEGCPGVSPVMTNLWFDTFPWLDGLRPEFGGLGKSPVRPRPLAALSGRSSPVTGLRRDDVADAASRVWNVAGVPRDDVEVEVRHGLASGGAIVEAEVESVGCRAEVRSQVLLGPVNPDQEPGLFGASQVFAPSERVAKTNCPWPPSKLELAPRRPCLISLPRTPTTPQT
jgi:hypothetical protein